jgi:ethanolamine ammonia-lyase large subunit
MLAYQSTSFHDALYLRETLGKRPAPEFEAWLETMGLFENNRRLTISPAQNRLIQYFSHRVGSGY